MWRGGNAGEDALLARSYRRSLEVAAENGLKGIAFPAISAGAYRYPSDRAARISVRTVADFLVNDARVKSVVFKLFRRGIG